MKAIGNYSIDMYIRKNNIHEKNKRGRKLFYIRSDKMPSLEIVALSRKCKLETSLNNIVLKSIVIHFNNKSIYLYDLIGVDIGKIRLDNNCELIIKNCVNNLLLSETTIELVSDTNDYIINYTYEDSYT